MYTELTNSGNECNINAAGYSAISVGCRL